MTKQELEAKIVELERRNKELVQTNHINYERAEVRGNIIRDMVEKNPGEHDVAWLRLGAECAKDVCIARKTDFLSVSDYMHILCNWVADSGIEET